MLAVLHVTTTARLWVH